MAEVKKIIRSFIGINFDLKKFHSQVCAVIVEGIG